MIIGELCDKCIHYKVCKYAEEKQDLVNKIKNMDSSDCFTKAIKCCNFRSMNIKEKKGNKDD